MRTDAEVAQAYDAHGAELFAVAVRSLGDRERAADAVQETFVRAWRGRDTYDPAIASMRTWLHAINRNVVVDQLRASAARPRLASVDGDRLERSAPTTAPDESIVDRELLAAAIRVLPEDQRRAVLAVHYEGHTAADHARAMGVPAGTVRSWVHRGLSTLRTELAGSLADA